MIIGGAVSARSLVKARTAQLTPVSLPAAELEAGAWLRDQGRLRCVQSIEPAVASESVRIFFEDDADRVDWLRVDLAQMVTVWQGEFDG